MMKLLAQAVVVERRWNWGSPAMWGWAEFLIFLIVLCGVFAVAKIVLTQVFQVQIPDWIVRIFWIVLAVFVAVFAIRLLLAM